MDARRRSRAFQATLAAAALFAAAAGAESARDLSEVGPGTDFTRFAALGDGGSGPEGRRRVCARVRSWDPDFVIGLGADAAPGDPPAEPDARYGECWSDFLHPYRGRHGKGGTARRYFPAVGAGDWSSPGAEPWLAYFDPPGNGRAYDVLRGPVHLFAVDADPGGPDGIGRDGRQARRLRRALAASPARWKIVFLHAPPHTSGARGPAKALRWPFREWGADAVIAGRDRHYERLEADGLVWFVNGLGGVGPAPAGPPAEGSRCLFDEADGAMLVEADRERIDFRFVTVDGVVADGFTLRKAAVARAAGQPAAIPVTASP